MTRSDPGYMKAWYAQDIAKHPDKYRIRSRKNSRRGWAPGEHEKAEAALADVVRCACCGSSDPRRKTGWVADHDHRTGLFRAHLCQPCNMTIGYIERYGLDMSPQAAVYLAAHSRTDA